MSREDGNGLLCPQCGKARLYVKDTRSTSGYVRRRRRCEDCGHSATTYEVIEQIGDPAGTRIGDMVQLRENMMKLTPPVRATVRQLISRLAEAGTKSPPEVAHSGPLTAPNGPPAEPEDIPSS